MENDKKVTAAEWLRKEIILNSKHKENSKGGTSFEIGLSKFDVHIVKGKYEADYKYDDDYKIVFSFMDIDKDSFIKVETYFNKVLSGNELASALKLFEQFKSQVNLLSFAKGK